MENVGSLLFVAAVTCFLLGRVFGGEGVQAETVAYAGTAAFGLNFVMASWRSLWA